MLRYDFEVRQGEKTIACLRAIEIQSARAMWHWIACLAKNYPAPKGRIRVTDQSGEIVILIGIAAARLRGLKQCVETKLAS